MLLHTLHQGGGWDYHTDVLVVGFGGAGACSAIEASDAGADVTIVEKQDESNFYSNTRMSGGGFHSPKPSGDKVALKQYALAMFSGENLPWKLEGELPTDIANDLAEKWAEYAPENLAWMQEIDPEFDAVNRRGAAFPDFPGAQESQYRVLRSTYSGEINNKERDQVDDPKELKESGEAFYTCLKGGVDDRDITIDWGTSAVEFVTDDAADEILGLVASRGGEQVSYESNAIILTTGGFEYNKNLRLNFLEGPGVEGWAFYGSPANTGRGIEMAMEIGASLSKVHKAAARMVTAIPTRKHGLKMGLRTPVIGRPHAIVVDNFGKRYAAERMITEDPSRYFFYKEGVKFDIDKLVYPRVPSWLIFDESLRKKRAVVGLRGVNYHGLKWGEDNAAAIENGWILQAETIDQLAEEIRNHPDNRELMDRTALSETVRAYNRYCNDGQDRDYRSNPKNMGELTNPPYYALPIYPGGPNTKGGIMANAERQVLDTEQNPIPNLYTAGEISSAFKFVYQGGGNLAECITFGRIAGKNAATYAMSGR